MLSFNKILLCFAIAGVSACGSDDSSSTAHATGAEELTNAHAVTSITARLDLRDNSTREWTGKSGLFTPCKVSIEMRNGRLSGGLTTSSVFYEPGQAFFIHKDGGQNQDDYILSWKVTSLSESSDSLDVEVSREEASFGMVRQMIYKARFEMAADGSLKSVKMTNDKKTRTCRNLAPKA